MTVGKFAIGRVRIGESLPNFFAEEHLRLGDVSVVEFKGVNASVFARFFHFYESAKAACAAAKRAMGTRNGEHDT